MKTGLSLAVFGVFQHQKRLIKENFFRLRLVYAMFLRIFAGVTWSQSKPVTCAQLIIKVYYQHIRRRQQVLTIAGTATPTTLRLRLHCVGAHAAGVELAARAREARLRALQIVEH